MHEANEKLLDALIALVAESGEPPLEAAERMVKDAKRYRWLRENDWDSPIVKLGYDDYDSLKGAELDAAVDAQLRRVIEGDAKP